VIELAAVGLGVLALLAAGRFRWLTTSGQIAAAVVGAAVLVGSGSLGFTLLVAFFLTSSLLGRFRAPVKSGSDQPKGRGAGQVLANGGAAALFSLLALAGWVPAAQYALAGAIAAATADTWATEIGSAGSWPTWSVIGEGRVRPGRSGGVSVPGTLAAGAGAALIGMLAGLLHGETAGVVAEPSAWVRLAIPAGMAGMFADSLLGATLENRLHVLGNDQVNLVCTLVGAAVALLLAPTGR
jgi:uncharacterized protein (TIGR00297 family)